MRVLAVVAVVALSACLGSPSGPTPSPQPQPPPGQEPSPTAPSAPDRVWLLRDFGFEGCQGIEVRAHVDGEAAQALLPANHTAATEPGATARWRIMECQAFTSGSATINDTLYGDVALAAGDHWYRFAIFSRADNLAAAWQVAGYDVVTGNATMEIQEIGPAASVTATFAGYEARFVAAAPTGGGEEAVLMTETALGRVVWNETGTMDGVQGVGTWSVPEGDPLAALLADGQAVPAVWTWQRVTIQDAHAYREW